MVHPLFAQPERPHVAGGIEDSERIPLLQHARPLAGARRGRENVVLLVEPDDFFHSYTDAPSVIAGNDASAVSSMRSRSYTAR